MIIKIDVDGVIRNIANPMCDIYNDMTPGSRMTPDKIYHYDVEKSFPLRKSAGISSAKFFFDLHARDIFGDGNKYGIYKGADIATRILKEAGHKIVICTWQIGTRNKIRTLKFLDRYGVEYDDIMFTDDKWTVKSDIFIDDNPEFLIDSRDDSEYKIIIDMPYNRHVDFIRKNSLLDAAKYILGE